MGVMDRYGRDKSGNVTRDGEDLSKKKASSIDVEIFIQNSYAQAVNLQNGNVHVKKKGVVTEQDILFAKEGYQANNRVEYINTSRSEYKYPGKDYVYPTETPTKHSFFVKIKKWLKLSK